MKQCSLTLTTLLFSYFEYIYIIQNLLIDQLEKCWDILLILPTGIILIQLVM